MEIEQNREKFASINGLTRVVVKPLIQSNQNENLINSESNSLNEWSVCLQIELQDESKYPIKCGKINLNIMLLTNRIEYGNLIIKVTRGNVLH